MKRIALFVLTNILVLAVIGVIVKVLGLDGYLQESGFGLVPLLIFSALFGFGGSIISLLISKWMAKRAMGVQVIDPNAPGSEAARWILETTYKHSREAGLEKMPEVGYWPSAEVNAFATGPSPKNSLVAVSAGLMENMTRDEAEAVIAHEVAHVANGDMVTMALLQGIVNTFAIFLSRVVANLISGFLGRDLGYMAYFLVVIVLQTIFLLLGNIVVMTYSRHREFRADAGSAKLAGREKMIAALERLQTTKKLVDHRQQALATMKISMGEPKAWMKLFMSHPPLEDRIAALRKAG